MGTSQGVSHVYEQQENVGMRGKITVVFLVYYVFPALALVYI